MTETTEDQTTDRFAELRTMVKIDLETETITFPDGTLIASYAVSEVAVQLKEHELRCKCPAVAGCALLRPMIEAAIHADGWESDGIPLDHFPALYEALYWLAHQSQTSAQIMLDALTLAARENGINTDMAERVKAIRTQLRDAVSGSIKDALEKSANAFGLPTVMLENTAADIAERVMREAGFAQDGLPLYGLEPEPDPDAEPEQEETDDAPEGLLDLLASLPDLIRSGGAVIGVATLERVPVSDSQDEPAENVAE